MKKIIILAIIVILAILGIKHLKPSSIPVQNESKDNVSVQIATTTSNSKTETPISTTPTVKTFTMAEVVKHADAKSCWTAINDKVYDVTTWIDEHPGGKQAILGLCGKDGTQAFEGKHGGQPRPNNELANFLIGALKK
jgi:cytochrome b involved in lipid metabolism